MTIFLGGVYGDFEVAPSTKVLEGRKDADVVYNRRLYNAKGGLISCYMAFVPGFCLSFVGTELLFKTHPKKLLILAAGTFGLSYFFNSFSIGIFGYPDQYRYLKRNKAEVLEQIRQAQLQDYLARNRIYNDEKTEETKEVAVEVNESENSESSEEEN